MKRILKRTFSAALVLAVATILVTTVQAAMVARMTLGEMTANSDRIFRGTVLDIEQSSVELNGTELPVVEYTLRVDEAFKGSFDSGKDAGVITIRMLGDIKSKPADEGSIQRFSVLPDLPRLEMGRDYVLFTTAPSAIGLSTTVGLGQGSFGIYTEQKQEMAANELDNAGIFQGPVTYAELARAIRSQLGQ